MTDPKSPSPGVGRSVRREALAEKLQALLPRHGVLAGGGGFVSSDWQVVVDLGGARLTGERVARSGVQVNRPLGDSVERALGTEELRHVRDAADGILGGRAQHEQRVMSADSRGVLIVVRDSAAFELAPAGPITEGEAATLHGLLYRLAWPERPPRRG